MYTTRNFKTKKDLKQAVQNGERVTYYQPNDMGFSPLPMTGRVFIEGPHYPKPHTWYAECVVEGGVIIKVR